MAISRIKDPITGNEYSRDEDVMGSTYAPLPSVNDTANLGPDNPLGATLNPTVADAYKGLQLSPYAGTDYDSALSKFGADALRTINAPVNEESEFRRSMRGYQTEVDAQNRLFAEQLSELKRDKTADIGRARAAEAAGLGSYAGVQQATRQANQPIDTLAAQNEARIAAISNAARQAAQQELQAKRAARQSGYQDYLGYLRETDTRKQSNAANLADTIMAQGLTLEEIDPAVLANAAKDYGVSENAVRNAFYAKQQEAQAAEQKRADDLAKQNLVIDPETGTYNQLTPDTVNLSEGSSLLQYNPESGRYEEVASKAKTYAPSTGGGGLPSTGGGIYDQLDYRTANAVISQGNAFTSDPTVKTYNGLVAAANLINGIDPNTSNPADHQALVYNFAKALDPDSVVREGEYETIKKYSQGLASKYSGEIKQATTGSGFLSPEAIQSIQEATRNRVTAYQPQYENVRNQTAQRINNIAGADVAGQVLLDFETGYSGAGPAAPSNPFGI